jgi:UDP-N-acetylglucosamine acyltransferase
MVGLKRAGFSLDQIKELKAAYRLLYRSGLKQEDALKQIEAGFNSEHTRALLDFVRSSQRGICRASKNNGGEE